MTEKERRKAIKKKIKDEELALYEEHRKMQTKLSQNSYDSAAIENSSISTQDQLEIILSKLGAMRLRGEIKLVTGSFDLNSIVHAEFIVKQSQERWCVYCLNDGAMGGGYLRKIG